MSNSAGSGINGTWVCCSRLNHSIFCKNFYFWWHIHRLTKMIKRVNKIS